MPTLYGEMMILLELENWHECRTAVLEYSNDTVYLYSYPHDENLDMKSLWVANTKKRLFSKGSIKSDMDDGNPPYMPKEYCNGNAYIKDFKVKENWDLQWGLDQNSIAVLYKGNIVAIMPEWSGVNGFWGYSIGTLKETPIAWPLVSVNEQINRFNKEKVFLDSWSETKWISFQENLLSKYDNYLSGQSRYFAADSGKWPPLGIHYCKASGSELIATVGMSILPMPLLGMHQENTADYRNIELAIICHNVEQAMPLASYLSGQATYPWHFGSHFAHGHTIPCAELAEAGSKMSFMLIAENTSFLPNIEIKPFDGTKVRLLYMIPIHESEKRYAEANSSSDLLKKLEKTSDPLSLKRNSIV